MDKPSNNLVWDERRKKPETPSGTTPARKVATLEEILIAMRGRRRLGCASGCDGRDFCLADAD